MTDLALLPDDGERCAIQPATAPALPVESHLVRAVRAAEAAKAKAEVVLFCLEHCPRDTNRTLTVLNEPHSAAEAALVHFCAFDSVRSCQGQG